MESSMVWQVKSTSPGDTQRLGELLGGLIDGPETIELRADLGGGKTTFVRGLALGMDSVDTVSSPTFTLQKIYSTRNGMRICHFDFYRLAEPGVVADQLAEAIKDDKAVTVVEWSEMVKNILPDDRLTIEFKAASVDSDQRIIEISYPAGKIPLVSQLETKWQGVRP